MNLDPKTFPTAKLKDPLKSTVRFMAIGAVSSLVQTGFFLLVMRLFGEPEQYSLMYNVAFVIGFILEMIPTFFVTCWYTFEAKPNAQNTSGFLLARALNLAIQMIVLPLSQIWFMGMNNGLISYIVIFVAGIVNFIVQYIFFKKKPKKPHENL